MSYRAEISRANPTAFVFLVDQSASMSEELEAGVSKAHFLADVLNKTLMELVIQCRKAEGILDYFDVGVLGYSNSSVRPGFGGSLSGLHLTQVSALAQSPLRVETRRRKVPDGTGGLVETEVKFPVWFDPQADGGTPMCAGLRTASQLVREWCNAHPRSFPPTVLHITDGEATDGDDKQVLMSSAEVTKQATQDGSALLLTLHVSGHGGAPIKFPSQENTLPNSYAKLLFQMSSALPPAVLDRVRSSGLPAGEGCRGYVFNGRMEEVLRFFEIGTRPRLSGGDR
jgi:hypothetical protein